ncbi:substrate-binding periplasmic protein [Paucibacter sp. Y2R2-4]|uniref:substrate-binding periplasmic protein n=1 Tax=Paucibacter sp. Y2R2-4 TaxID=2893553 RepID=UPI0021E4A2C4|nr:transporter substrate-binding domain-containing protein [Paucibacter sp. Y2R2-4]MCV2349165.1 transporter substrate-binding domain-containing protein [Paucibacter sp. Y2R2-4]
MAKRRSDCRIQALGLLLLSGLCSWALGAEPEARPLRMGISQSWAMPFASYEKGHIKGGILLELAQEIAKRLDAPLQIQVIPPRRVEAMLKDSAVDLHCLVSPEWLNEKLPSERWTELVLRMDDVLLAPATYQGKTLDLDRVAGGVTVGLVTSYLYPALDEALSSGRMLREDAPSQALVFEKMLRGRSDFAVSNRLIADWFNKQQPQHQRLKFLQTLASVNTACALAPKPGLEASRIKSAVKQMVKDGAVEQVLQRYR